MSDTESVKPCLNCGAKLPEGSLYCCQCGQSIKETKLSFTQILTDASNNLLNLDSRLIHTIKDIYLPSKLTETYVRGKRKYYVNPARLFIFTLLALISLGLYFQDFGIPSISQEMTEHASNIEVKKLFDSLKIELGTEASKPVFDTIDSRVFKNLEGVKSEIIGENIYLFGHRFSDYNITKYDAVHLSAAEVFEKYNITGLRAQIEVRQFLKITTDTEGGVKYVIKNFSWVVFLLVFIMALILKLLYIRRNYYYVEHLVLLLYGHSFLFILLIIVFLLNYFDALPDYLAVLSLLFIVVTQYLAFLFYYKQGKFKTLLKLLVFNSIYLFVFIAISLLVSLISVIIF